MNWWGEGTEAEWRERWRLERLREDEMLAYHNAVGGRITNKALAEKFNLTPTRVGLLVRRRERERMCGENKRLKDELERLKASPVSSFTALAERLWMDLGWLAAELENRRVDEVG